MKQALTGVFGDEHGFTLVEIIAVLVMLGILAAVAIPKYISIQETSREQAAQGQLGEVKGRLAQALANYMLLNSGNTPASGSALVTATNTYSTNACPTSSTLEGDFTFSCNGAGGAKTVTISVTAVQGNTLTTPQTATYDFTNAG